MLWFLVNRDTEDDEDDGGLERGVKQFSRTLSFISMVWRVSSNPRFSDKLMTSDSFL